VGKKVWRTAIGHYYNIIFGPTPSRRHPLLIVFNDCNDNGLHTFSYLCTHQQTLNIIRMQYFEIAVKLLTGMIGILVFLRIAGKAQMAQLTPLDTVSAFVIGALVGGVLYNPDMTALHILFALAVWTAFNLFIRFCMRSKVLRRLIKGDSVYLVKNGAINFKAFKRNSLEMEQFRLLLRQKGVFSMFDIEDVRFETNGSITVAEVGKVNESYLLVNNGAIVDSSLFHCGKTRQWVLRHIKHYGYENPSQLFCMEWTPGKGFYLVAKNGDVKRGSEEIAAEEIAQEVLN
jgi:hypothetical protein